MPNNGRLVHRSGDSLLKYYLPHYLVDSLRLVREVQLQPEQAGNKGAGVGALPYGRR